MKTTLALGLSALALAAGLGAKELVIDNEAAYNQAEGARNIAAVLATTQLPPAKLQEQISADCKALKQGTIDGAAANCAAMRCATGVSPTWSACPAQAAPATLVGSR